MDLGELLTGVGLLLVVMVVVAMAGRMGEGDLVGATIVGMVLVAAGLIKKGDRKG